ncbi:uncharacterized protein LACBIDRAFT_334323 [Laccaria bicolor S238N-H82]|uniref:Predicted protein n=1 Tax=Laccaria bicolor (strain S238N-H82 / ATCC MYA-4686) TaxID=486041 RepID=B0DYU8_LACBS|nr:uncharacterized protein LACBIDRAFT_334323 [Laccaria bicolor S238N-H82]EDR00202.1 predicted protein [Laccaria bicolor S238N-H82]|eukprot:XP_001889111.1 predicted protein [Laccaria bicolor S238N-H82]
MVGFAELPKSTHSYLPPPTHRQFFLAKFSSMSKPTSSFLVIPPAWLKEPLLTQANTSSIVPQIIKVVEALWDWYHTKYPKADEDERNGQEESLCKIIVTYLRAIHVLQRSEDIDMPAIMEHVCMEIVDTNARQFAWEVLDEPEPEQEDEMEEIDALLMSWEPPEPSRDKGKAKATVDVVKAERSSESGKMKGEGSSELGKKGRSWGQKRKEEEVMENPEEAMNTQGKKARMQSGGSGGSTAGHAPTQDNGDDDYDFTAMGAKVTPTVPHCNPPCDQCVRWGDQCTAEMGIRGQACDACHAKKSGCSNVSTGCFKVNTLISDPPPMEAAAPSKNKSAGGTSKPQGMGKPKVKVNEVAGKVKATKARGSSKAKAIKAGGSSKPKVTAAGGSSKPPPQAAFVLVPEHQTTVYALVVYNLMIKTRHMPGRRCV